VILLSQEGNTNQTEAVNMLVKCGRVEIDLTNKDEVMYNGHCYQITSRKVGHGWNTSIPMIAKRTAEKMIKDGKLVLERKEIGIVDVEIYKISE
jgi:hypothetical protein